MVSTGFISKRYFENLYLSNNQEREFSNESIQNNFLSQCIYDSKKARN